jgi:hypothetical protein
MADYASMTQKLMEFLAPRLSWRNQFPINQFVAPPPLSERMAWDRQSQNMQDVRDYPPKKGPGGPFKPVHDWVYDPALGQYIDAEGQPPAYRKDDSRRGKPEVTKEELDELLKRIKPAL